MMPQLLTVHIHERQGRPFRIWIPLLPVFLIVSPILILVALILAVLALAHRRNPMRAFVGTWGVIAGLRGLDINITEDRTAVRVSIT